MLENKDIRGIVITGAAGFIGSHTVEYFLRRGCRVLALDVEEVKINVANTKLNKNLTCYKWNLFERDPLPEDIINQGWDVFIHLAWAGSAGQPRLKLDLQIENAEASAACVRLASDLGCKKFIGAGSLMEYEVEQATHKAKELTSTNYYAYGKLLAHYLCKIEAQAIGIDFIWGIITNAYGPGETAPRFINTTIRKVLNNEELQFSSGLQNYDFVYVTDVAQAFYCIAEYGEHNQEYLIGSGNPHRLQSFICLLLEACGSQNVPIFNPRQRVDCELPIELFSVEKLFFIGYSPRVSFTDGIKYTKEWIEKQ